MPIAPTFRAAVNVLAELAADNHPAYVRVDAASKLAKLLSPANPHYGDILHALNDDPSDVRQTRAPQIPSPPTENPCAVFLTDGDEEEEDESEAAEQEDEPP